jgi:hypothetical protein
LLARSSADCLGNGAENSQPSADYLQRCTIFSGRILPELIPEPPLPHGIVDVSSSVRKTGMILRPQFPVLGAILYGRLSFPAGNSQFIFAVYLTPRCAPRSRLVCTHLFFQLVFPFNSAGPDVGNARRYRTVCAMELVLHVRRIIYVQIARDLMSTLAFPALRYPKRMTPLKNRRSRFGPSSWNI